MMTPSPIAAVRTTASALVFTLVLGSVPLGSMAQTPTATTTQTATTPPTASSGKSGEITEEDLKRDYVGKPLFLRGGYLGDNISFTEHGDPIGHPTKGSYTLSGIQIEKVRITKHKVEFEGARYAMHFLGAMPYEDPDKAVDRVKITPKKKTLRITIDREQVVKPKKEKDSKQPRKQAAATHTAGTPALDPSSQTGSAPASATAQQPSSTTEEKDSAQESEKPAEQAAEQAADPGSVTTTIDPAHATRMLREALDKVFATGLDERVKAQMPPFWQLYYKAQAAGVDYRPSDPTVVRSNAVDQQAKLTSSIAPDSNEYAQASGIAGRALYRAVIGPDGKPGEIAVVRPIGFGLDENAVAAIRKATFQPAIKAGAPVPETLDLAVLFRIYSKRTSVAATGTPGEPKSADTAKPGPFTLQQQKNQPAQAPDATQPPQQDTSQQPPSEPATQTPTDSKPAQPDPQSPPKL